MIEKAPRYRKPPEAVPPSDERALLDVQHLSTRFSTGQGIVHAVDDVSLSVAAGKSLGIVGESGSGKSVLARSIMRLNPPRTVATGTIDFAGLALHTLSRKDLASLWGSRVSMIFQDPSTSLNPVRRIGHQLTEVLMIHLGMTRNAAKSTALELLNKVGIPEPERRLRSYPHELSGGMRQRISIAIAIACNPALLFADEPTTALDVTIQRQILDLLAEIQAQQGMAMVLITHDLGVVARRTDHVAVMYGGRIVEAAPTPTLFTSMRHPYTASLLASVPRLEDDCHTRLAVIPGRPIVVLDPKPGCRFAPRCVRAQMRCINEDPPLEHSDDGQHSFACFYPMGSTRGDQALAANVSRGSTATGLSVTTQSEVRV